MLDIRMGDNGEIVLSGRFDASQASSAEAFLDGVAEARVIDIKGLEYISSAGLGVLLKTQKRLMKSGKGLVLVNASKHIFDIFHFSGFDQIFEIQKPSQP
jgi:anti-anti-sigma factor